MVPIGTQGTVLPYIDPTEGPPRFCMDWVGTGRCRAFCKKFRLFGFLLMSSEYENIFRFDMLPDQGSGSDMNPILAQVAMFEDRKKEDTETSGIQRNDPSDGREEGKTNQPKENARF